MSTMTINTALRRIAAIKGDIARLEARRPHTITFKNSQPVAWDYHEVTEKVDALRVELIDLKARVAYANATTLVDNGKRRLVDVIIELQELRGQIKSDEALMTYTKATHTFTVPEAQHIGTGYIQVEIPWSCRITSAELDEKLASLRARFATLNAVVEAANYTTEV